jgi:hypothetical protein
MNTSERDRYVSFDGLECDRNASEIIATIRRYMALPDGGGKWGKYFTNKFAEQRQMGTDELFFVGSQMNNLYAFFEEIGDEVAMELLYQVEQECC